jgi:SpoVK/Ycf46/Vps4 family AAA+-type ATPase
VTSTWFKIVDHLCFLRLEKRVFVSLPEYEARVAMIKKHLSCRAVNELDYDKVCGFISDHTGSRLKL